MSMTVIMVMMMVRVFTVVVMMVGRGNRVVFEMRLALCDLGVQPVKPCRHARMVFRG